MERTILQQGIMLQQQAEKMVEMDKAMQEQANLLTANVYKNEELDLVVQVGEMATSPLFHLVTFVEWNLTVKNVPICFVPNFQINLPENCLPNRK